MTRNQPALFSHPPRTIHLIVAALLTASGLAVAQTVFYVAPNGNDAWSGRRPDRAADGKDGPFATLPAALKAARQAKQAAATRGGVVVHLRGGVYELTEPLVLSPEDSGASADAPLAIAAYADEKPVLSGGRRITGWRAASGRPGLWQAEIPAAREGRWYFRSLFVDGRRATRARTPNEGAFFRMDGARIQDKPVQFKFRASDIRPEWASDPDVEVIGLEKWTDWRMHIRTVDGPNRTVTLSGSAPSHTRESGARYIIENAPDALDAPGEWRLDRQTGMVTYRPRPGEDMTQAEVIAPHSEELVRLQGDFAARRPVQHVHLRGLTFRYTDWSMGPEGYYDRQAAVAVPGDLYAEGAVDCVVEDCTFSQLAGYAVDFAKGCQRNTVIGNEMFDLGAGGVRLGEPAVRSDPFEQNHSHRVTDNHIHQVGVIFTPAIGVFVIQSGANRVAHNHIHHLYYSAMSVGWTWGYRESPCRANVIEFNHLHHIGQNMLSDMGGVYTLGIQPGTVIRNNLIHDVVSFTYGGWGLYTDEGSTGIVLENNVVYRTKSAGFHQHYGRENVVRNNVFAFGKENQVMRTREETHLSFFFTNNIVYFDSGNLLGSNWKNDRFVMDANLYFDARPGATPESLRFKEATLDEWRKRGHDQHSLIADPQFVAPEKDDFTLKPASPALKLGFNPIDLRTVGVRPKALRTRE